MTPPIFNTISDTATPPEWIPFLPKPGTYGHPQEGEITISRASNQRLVQSFTTGVYQDRLPIDAEHQMKLSGALGWITAMRLNDDGSVDAQTEWTERGTKLIADNRFRYFSPEWFETWTDPATGRQHTDIAVGGALTTRPFFKPGSLCPLVAQEGRLYAASEHTFGNGQTAIFLDPLARTALATKGSTPMTTNLTDLATRDGAWSAITTAAKRFREDGDPDDAAAIDRLMQTPDGARLYRAYEAGTPHAAPLPSRTTGPDIHANENRFWQQKVEPAANRLVERGTALTFEEAIDRVFTDQPQFYAEYQDARNADLAGRRRTG